MRIIRIPKKSGGVRVIYCPTPAAKKAMRRQLPGLTRIAMLLDKQGVMHGFMPCRSAVTNAAAHIGYRYSLCFDLKNFFDNVTDTVFYRAIDGHALAAYRRDIKWVEIMNKCFPDGAAKQGLPTSPMIANIAYSVVDDEINAMRSPYDIAYTRYADDLTFSFNDLEHRKLLMCFLPTASLAKGFPINEKKTRFQSASQGRRMITGVGVDYLGVHPTRRTKRRLRAARHQGHLSHANGLSEWAKCKAPHYPTWSVAKLTEDCVGNMPVVALAGIHYDNASV